MINFKKAIVQYHFWVIGILVMMLQSCSTSYRVLKDENGGQKIYNEKYGDDPKHKMDIFIPNQFSPETPVVMIVHGGAWKYGRKAHMKMIQKFLYENKIPNININYRLINKNLSYKDQLQDIQKAIEKSNEILPQFQLKKDNFILIGESAGGHLALLYGYQNPQQIKKLISLSGPTDFYSEDFLKQFYSKYTLPTFEMVVGEKFNRKNISEKFREASPIANVTAVPTLIFQGDRDLLVNKKQGLALAEVLKEKNIPNKLVFMKNSGHVPRFVKRKRENIIFPNILSWIKE